MNVDLDDLFHPSPQYSNDNCLVHAGRQPCRRSGFIRTCQIHPKTWCGAFTNRFTGCWPPYSRSERTDAHSARNVQRLVPTKPFRLMIAPSYTTIIACPCDPYLSNTTKPLHWRSTNGDSGAVRRVR